MGSGKAAFNGIFSGKLLQNLVSLSVLQLANTLLPLVTFPYLVRVLGEERVGAVYFAQAVITYFVIFTEYGFNLTATREIALHRDDKARVEQITNTVFTIKTGLILASFILLLGLTYIVPAFAEARQLLLLTFLMVPGYAFIPVWFYQGYEQMHFITFLTLGAKLVYAATVFTLINEPGDFLWVNPLNAVASMGAEAASMYIIYRVRGFRYRWPGMAAIRQELKLGSSVFTAHLAQNVTANANLVILGMNASPLVTGWYSIAEKVIFPIRQVINSLFQVLYPHLVRLMGRDPRLARQFNTWLVLLLAVGFSTAGVVLYYSAPFIIKLVAGKEIPQSARLLEMLAPLPLIIALGIVPFQQLFAARQQQAYFRVVLVAVVANLALNFSLSKLFGASGTVTAVLASETLLMAGLYLMNYLVYARHTAKHPVE